MGKKGEIKLPSGGVRVDLTGKTVIPALVDAHAHLGHANYNNWTNGKMNYNRENLIDHLNRAAYFGLAAIFSAGTDVAPICYEVRDEVLAGKYPNVARFVPSGPGFTSRDTANPATQREDAYIVSTPEQARMDVRELASNRVKVIKAWVNSGGGNRFASKEPMDPEVYKAFIDEAHKHNMRVFIHAHIPEEAKDLIRAGNEGFAHAIDDIGTPPDYLKAKGRPAGPDAEVLAMLKERGPKIFMTLTQPSPIWLDAERFRGPEPLLVDTVPPGPLATMREKAEKPPTPEEQERAHRNWEARKVMTQQFVATGIRIGVGSDADLLGPNMIGWAMHTEMEEMVASGITPADVIVAGTKTNAEWLQLDDLGTVAPKKTASFVVLDGNPLDDIKNTRLINAVYLGGSQVDRAGLKAGWAKAWSDQPGH